VWRGALRWEPNILVEQSTMGALRSDGETRVALSADVDKVGRASAVTRYEVYGS